MVDEPWDVRQVAVASFHIPGPDILSKARAHSQVTDRWIETPAPPETEPRSLMQFVVLVTASDIAKSHIEVVYTARRNARPVFSSNVVSQERRRPHPSGYLQPACVPASDGDSPRFPNPSQWTQERLLSRFRGIQSWGSPTHLRRATTVSVSFTLRYLSQLALTGP